MPMLTRRTRAVAAVLEGHLYVIGGNDGDMALSSGGRCDLKRKKKEQQQQKIYIYP